MSKKNDLKDLLDRANIVHNNKYDYSLIGDYKSMTDIVDIICPVHGIFQNNLHYHINKGRGCAKCARENRKDNIDSFVKKAEKVHGNKYDYSKSSYINAHTKINITCPIHGEFWQNPCDHINNEQGCPECGKTKNKGKIKENIITNFGDFFNHKQNL